MQYHNLLNYYNLDLVTILVLVEYSLQFQDKIIKIGLTLVTILVLVEYSLQSSEAFNNIEPYNSHNPCFSRILFAIAIHNNNIFIDNGHNPCFSRILFAIY